MFITYKKFLIIVLLIGLTLFFGKFSTAKAAVSCDCGCGCGQAACYDNGGHSSQFLGCFSSSNPACACAPPPDPCAGNTQCGQCGNPACCTPNCSGYQCGQSNGCGGTCGSGDRLTGCTPACGQKSVCGVSCGSANAGTPGNIASSTPTNGSVVTLTPPTTTITLTWTAATNATKYDLELYPANTDCNNALAFCTYTASGGGILTTSYTFTPKAASYFFRVRGVNTNCVSAPVNVNASLGTWTSGNTFTNNSVVSGTVYNDPNGVAVISGSLCIPSGGPGTTILPGAGSTVVVSDAGGIRSTNNIAANGTYSGTALLSTSTSIALSPTDTSYACTCPTGCNYGGILPPKVGVNFYVSQVGGNWFQIMGGDLNTSSKSILSLKDPIPAICTSPTCEPYVMIAPTGQTTAQIGAVYSYTSANIDTSDASGNQNSPVGPVGANYPIKTHSSIACKENYDYFARLYSLGTNPVEDFVAPQNNPDQAHKPDISPKNFNFDGTNKGAYYHGGDLTIDQAWTLGASESYTIFVNGNLNITNGATIIVPSNAYLAFYVKGNITFDASIGTTPNSTTGTIQGIYVANGNLTVNSVGANPTSDELKFVGEGTFAACGNISLPRDYRNSTTGAYGLNNNKYPSNLFIFRPDFITSAPDKIKRPIQNWREIAP